MTSNSWKTVKLGDVVETNSRNIDKNYPYTQIVYLDTSSISCNKIDNFQYIDLKEAPSRAKRLVQIDDIIYSTVRPNKKHYGFIKKVQPNLIVSTGFVTISCNKLKLNPRFFYYYLTQNSITEYLHSIAEASTTTYPSLKPSDIESLYISLPPLPEQERIASILGALDDKIELNNRINKNLEEQASALFKHWFVDFEFPDENGNPYKSSGGELIDAELGKIPKGWEIRKLGDICNKVVSGGTPKSNTPEYYEGGHIPWLNTKEVNFDRIYSTEKNITEVGLNNSSAKWIDKNSIVIAMYGATAGKVAITKIPLTTNQACCNLTINKFKANYILIFYFLLMNYNKLASLANGGAQQNLNSNHIKNFKMILPPLKEQGRITEILSALEAEIERNDNINKNLAQLRDILLPKLMKNEIENL